MMNKKEEQETDMLKREVWVEKIIPALILFSLWLDGWFFPLILLPIIYVLFVEKKNLGWLGFSRHEIWFSLVIGVLIAFVLSGICYPIFLYYLPMMKREIVTIYSIFWMSSGILHMRKSPTGVLGSYTSLSLIDLISPLEIS